MRCYHLYLVFFTLVSSLHSFELTGEQKQNNATSFTILSTDFSSVEQPFVVASWLVIASGAKILFHFLRPISKHFPDSSLLVFVGLIVGIVLHYGIDSIKAEYHLLQSEYFFLFLLPPIIFDAGYFMPNRALFENFGSVMLFAVIGTIWNTIAIGLCLYTFGTYGYFSVTFDMFEVLTFTSLISAVDPVAVIAVFEEIHVNEFLFINVFGEALFNDAVSVVLYKMFRNFYTIGGERVQPSDYAKGFVSFFAIALGGAGIGLTFALLVSIVTKYSDHIRILAPLFVFVLPYMGYLVADSLGMSAIMTISICGMFMKQYVKGNITPAAANSVKYFTKMLAVGAETVLFMFLGVSAIVTPHHVDWNFIIATVFACLVFRSLGVVVQCAILNKFRKKRFSVVDQFILSYGGLRGAIAFGLAVSLPDEMQSKQMFVTTTIAVIYFTVLLQGITIRPIVNWLEVERRDSGKKTMTESIYMKYIDYTMSGVEEIFGIRGEHYFRDNFERLNAKILRPLLMRNVTRKNFDASGIIRAYAKITLEEALDLTHILVPSHKPKRNEFADKQRKEFRNEHMSQNEKSYYDKNSRTNTANQITEDSTSVEILYSLFSELLDRKLAELKHDDEARVPAEDELQDDYMAQLAIMNHRAHVGPSTPSTEQTRQYSAPFSISCKAAQPTRAQMPRRMSTGSISAQLSRPQ